MPERGAGRRKRQVLAKGRDYPRRETERVCKPTTGRTRPTFPPPSGAGHRTEGLASQTHGRFRARERRARPRPWGTTPRPRRRTHLTSTGHVLRHPPSGPRSGSPWPAPPLGRPPKMATRMRPGPGLGPKFARATSCPGRPASYTTLLDGGWPSLQGQIACSRHGLGLEALELLRRSNGCALPIYAREPKSSRNAA
jgi:hypothetical protein